MHAIDQRTRPLIGQTIAAAQGRSVDLQAELSGLLQAFIADEEQQLTELADGWVERTQRLRDWLDDQTQNNRTAWNGQKLQSRFYTPWLDELSRWAQSPLGTPRLDLNDSARRRLCRAGMLEAYRREPHTLALPEVFDQLPTLQADIDSMTPLSALLRRHAAHHIALRLATLKRQSRTFSFADMTARLERALTGPRGSVLRTHILDEGDERGLIPRLLATLALPLLLACLLHRTDHDSEDDERRSILGCLRGCRRYVQQGNQSHVIGRQAERHTQLDLHLRGDFLGVALLIGRVTRPHVLALWPGLADEVRRDNADAVLDEDVVESIGETQWVAGCRGQTAGIGPSKQSARSPCRIRRVERVGADVLEARLHHRPIRVARRIGRFRGGVPHLSIAPGGRVRLQTWIRVNF